MPCKPLHKLGRTASLPKVGQIAALFRTNNAEEPSYDGFQRVQISRSKQIVGLQRQMNLFLNRLIQSELRKEVFTDFSQKNRITCVLARYRRCPKLCGNWG